MFYSYPGAQVNPPSWGLSGLSWRPRNADHGTRVIRGCDHCCGLTAQRQAQQRKHVRLSAVPAPIGPAAALVPMVHDVDYIAVGCSDEEPAHPPWLGGYRMHDLVAEFLSFCVGTFDVIRVNGNDRVFGCVGIAGDELDVRTAVGRGVAGHPSHVELLGAQPEVVGVEGLCRINVSHSKVRHDAFSAHAVLLPVPERGSGHRSSVCRARNSTTAPAKRSLRSPATICPAPPTSTKSISGNRAMNSSAFSFVTRSLVWPRTRSMGTLLRRIASTAACMRSTSVTSMGGSADVPSMNFGSQCQYQRPPRRRRFVRSPSRSVGRPRLGLYSCIASATSSSEANPDVIRSYMKLCIRVAPD